MFKKNVILSILILGLVFLGVQTKATDYSSTDFTVKDSVITPGGNLATSASYGLWSSFGQPAIGLSSTSSFILKSGFLYFPSVTTATSSTSTPSQPVVITGGGGGGLANFPNFVSLKPEILAKCDFNNDGRCDIIDFSILLHYYGQTGPQISRYDLGNFGIIDIRDISILFYYWTS